MAALLDISPGEQSSISAMQLFEVNLYPLGNMLFGHIEVLEDSVCLNSCTKGTLPDTRCCSPSPSMGRHSFE